MLIPDPILLVFSLFGVLWIVEFVQTTGPKVRRFVLDETTPKNPLEIELDATKENAQREKEDFSRHKRLLQEQLNFWRTESERRQKDLNDAWAKIIDFLGK